MTYEWDETKRLTNLKKHGVDFEEVRGFRWATAQVRAQMRFGELRYGAYGYIDDRLHYLVYTMRGGAIRVISLRKTNRAEENRYAAS